MTKAEQELRADVAGLQPPHTHPEPHLWSPPAGTKEREEYEQRKVPRRAEQAKWQEGLPAGIDSEQAFADAAAEPSFEGTFTEPKPVSSDIYAEVASACAEADNGEVPRPVAKSAVLGMSYATGKEGKSNADEQTPPYIPNNSRGDLFEPGCWVLPHYRNDPRRDLGLLVETWVGNVEEPRKVVGVKAGTVSFYLMVDGTEATAPGGWSPEYLDRVNEPVVLNAMTGKHQTLSSYVEECRQRGKQFRMEVDYGPDEEVVDVRVSEADESAPDTFAPPATENQAAAVVEKACEIVKELDLKPGDPEERPLYELREETMDRRAGRMQGILVEVSGKPATGKTTLLEILRLALKGAADVEDYTSDGVSTEAVIVYPYPGVLPDVRSAVANLVSSEDTLLRAAIKEAKDRVASETHEGPFDPVKGYEDLARILSGAYDQSARGKGKERHANGLPFHEQPILSIARMSGLGGHTYQIMKKAQEAGNMAKRGNREAAIAEFRGVIVYAAAAILLTEEEAADDYDFDALD